MAVERHSPNKMLILLCLEFNKSNKQNVCHINLFKKFNFFQSQNNCLDRQMSVKITLLSRPTVLQLKGVSDTMPNLFENHQPQRTQISTVGNAPFIQNKLRFKWPPVLTEAASKLFGSQGCSDAKN